jgi:hypothetical protein
MRLVGVALLKVDRETRSVVMGLMDSLRTELAPMLAPRWRRPVQWVDEGLVAVVRYLERTPTGLLRHVGASGAIFERMTAPGAQFTLCG